MHTGNITKLFQEKKYGVIRTEDGEEIHFHEHCLWDTQFKDLSNGQKVEFEMQRTHKGFLGFQIRRYAGKRKPDSSQLTTQPD